MSEVNGTKMHEWWKDLFGAIGIVLLAVIIALLVKPPKLDAIVKANDPKLYVPLLSLICVVWVAIIYRVLRKVHR